MKKKSTPKLKQNPKAQLRHAFDRITTVVTTHAVLVVFVIAGLSIGLALVRARSYLNPVRDENRYEQAIAKNTYNKIDYTLVRRLQASLSSGDVQVNQSLSPNRNNPFSE